MTEKINAGALVRHADSWRIGVKVLDFGGATAVKTGPLGEPDKAALDVWRDTYVEEIHPAHLDKALMDLHESNQDAYERFLDLMRGHMPAADLDAQLGPVRYAGTVVSSAWEERDGARCYVLDPGILDDHKYPFAGLRPADCVVYIPDDPMRYQDGSKVKPHRLDSGRPWSCVLERRNVIPDE